MAACAVVYLGVGALAGSVLKTRPAAAHAVTRVSGAMTIVIGGFLLVEARPCLIDGLREDQPTEALPAIPPPKGPLLDHGLM